MAKKHTMIIDELRVFRNRLLRYSILRSKQIMRRKSLGDKESKERSSLFDEISVNAGKYTTLIKELTGLETISTAAGPQDVWNWALSTSSNTLVVKALDNCFSAVSRTIGGLETDINNGIRDKKTGLLVTPQTEMTAEAPKAFIAHEGMTGALQKVKTLLDALGVGYSIAEIEPSNGRVVEGQVQWTQEQADFAIILATKGKVINKETGKPYMGMNVADELGRAREVFRNRIILLLQKGVEPHTNVSGIVYEPFTPQNMEKAFTKIVKELRNWDLIRVGKVEAEK